MMSVDLRAPQLPEVGQGLAFAAALAEGSRFAVQFHPEKSHTHGLQLLQNFAAWDGRW